MKRMNFVIACLRPSQNSKFGIFTSSRVVDGNEMYKKAWCTCKVIVLPCETFAFLTFWSPPHLKLPIIYDTLWSVKNRKFSGQIEEELRRNCSPIGHNNTNHFVCPIRSRHPLEFFGNSPVRVGTQGLFRPYLKTLVPPFLPTRLTAPGSPRMVWAGLNVKGLLLRPTEWCIWHLNPILSMFLLRYKKKHLVRCFPYILSVDVTPAQNL